MKAELESDVPARRSRTTAKLAISAVFTTINIALLGGPAGLAHRCVMQLPRPPRTDAGLAPWQRRLIERYLEEHRDDAVRMADLVKATRLSTSHFSRVFKRVYGEKFSTYVIRWRLERAKQMMAGTDRTLGSIAVACGFCDQSHFNRMFRRAEGITPVRWLERRGDEAS